MRARLLQTIINHEGYEQFPYLDTVGKLTVGIGFNLDDVGLNKEESEVILKMRVSNLYDALKKYSWFNTQNEARQDALLDMAYNLGVTGLLGFKKMIAALIAQDYEEAAVQALDSKWAVQVGRRAHKIADILESGEWI